MTAQIAAQLYTLRDYTKTPADIARTLSRVKKLGYDAVQLSALGPIAPNELASILQNEGLICCATHTPRDRLENEPQAVIEEHRLWNCTYTAIGGFFPKDGGTPDEWSDFIHRYNAIASNYAGSGLSIGYHNHSHELARLNGEPMLKTLIEKLDRSIWFELDTYWITHGGGDPVQWINRVNGRLPCVHLKDMAISPKSVQFMAEVGEGNLNFPAIMDACRAAGTKWFIVEQDTCYRDPFDSLETSLKNLKQMGAN
ncbi:MAG: sugar phosphate isomerase/epimerase [Phycisphaerae bacterium]|nr:sugar phosphate isomerase/epimerase [Phycisphaerae bacterium]